jgi:NRAMP (natural resistance-associated macrophage protein)-like metal ion transporter
MSQAGRRQRRRATPRDRLVAAVHALGPGVVSGAADDDPSGIATYSQAGAQFGFGLLWTTLLTTPFMIAIQLAAARVGRVTGLGLAGNLRAHWPRHWVIALVSLLVAANTINITADIAAMGEALRLVVGGGQRGYSLLFGLVVAVLQVVLPYWRLAAIFNWLSLTLLVYVAVLFTVHVDWISALSSSASIRWSWWSQCWAPRSARTCFSGRPRTRSKRCVAMPSGPCSSTRSMRPVRCCEFASTRSPAWCSPT